MDRYCILIVRCGDGSLYTGIAKNLELRLEAHKNGSGSKYIRAHLPIQLVYTEKCTNRSNASKREIQIKKMNKIEKEKIITLFS